MKKLPPQHMRPKYYMPVEDQLTSLFYDLLFRNLIKIAHETNAQMSLSKNRLTNAAENDLQRALRTGRIQYEAGVFSGVFSAGIVKVLRSVGANRDAKQNVYKLEPSKVPGWIKAEAAHYQQTSKGAHDAMLRQLDSTQKDLDQLLDKATVHAGETIRSIQADFRDVAEAIRIQPELSEDSAKRLATDYNRNMKLYIKDFSKKSILDLRDVVQKNAEEGYRFDKLIDGLKGRYAVTKNKAKFLARQETGLFMAKYRRERFSEAGVTHYRWSTSHDARVRPEVGLTAAERRHAGNHRRLDGHVFAYADPPVVDPNTNRKGNPGEDYNCRCVDIPLLERVLEAA